MNDPGRPRRRAIIAVTDTARGGAPSRLATVARGMRARDWEIVFFSLMPEGPVAAELRSDGFTVKSLGMLTWRDAPRALLRLRREIKQIRPLVVQSALWHANLMTRLAAAGADVPVVNGHESVDEDKPRLRTVVDVVTGGLAAAHSAVAETVAVAVSARDRVPRGKIQVIPIAKDWTQWAPRNLRDETRLSLGIPQEAPVIAWSGRLHRVKNVGMLLAALVHLPEWWLLLIGEGELRKDLEQEAEVLGVAGRVSFVGEVADVARYLEAADVFCMVSHWEGLPTALMEAMAMGLPTVAPSVGAIPDLIDTGETGLLSTTNDPKILADAVRSAASTPALGDNAQAFIRKRFRESEMIEKHEALWLAVARSE